MIGIYKIENLVNGKKYIGQSVDIKDRWKEHKQIAFRQTEAAKICEHYPLYCAFRKYGLENFDFSVIEECDEKELNEKEIYWIAYYKTFIQQSNSWGYNLTRGGDGNKRLPQEYVDWFIELWNQGKLTGEIERITGKDKHIIIQYLKWYEPSYSVEEARRRGSISSGINHRKPIIQYDYLGRFITKYESIKEAAKKFGRDSSIFIKSAKLKAKGALGYYFVYDDENREKSLRTLIDMRVKNKPAPIIQFDLKGKFIACYSSLQEGSEKTGIPKGSINANCCSAVKTAHGFIWKYLTYEDIEKYNLKEIVPKFN